MVIYMAVTRDKYELPVYMEESMTDLGKLVGLHKSVISKHVNGKLKRSIGSEYKYVKVEVDDDK